MPPLLGAIADDFTGATDLAGMLVKNGMRSAQMIGVPAHTPPEGLDAIVVALKTRTTPAKDAVDASLAALAWLREAGCRQFIFKYCSTFDSTSKGNIGPVADALMAALGTDFSIACPAFPANGRTIFRGYLFVGDVLLNECGMQNHPLTPMTDANLVRVLQPQSKHKVGLVRQESVSQGAVEIQRAFADVRQKGVGIAIVDAVSNADLTEIGYACRDLPLVTGGSGLAIGLAANFRAQGLLPAEGGAGRLPHVDGHAAVVSGSCSLATQRQVAALKSVAPAFQIDPRQLAAGNDVVSEAVEWAVPRLAAGPPLIYATADAEQVRAIQQELGAERAGALVENALAAIARRLVDSGVRRLIVAGGETSGAVAGALGVTGLRIGEEIDPGVPWTVTMNHPALALALKSGNFGTDDFFLKAWSRLP
ncbi:MAG: four-carbon acid sugar kinase family protein [Bryobacterales bacterium]|nr:four-carbon acid sugar kinase family protein [Bryobacterales bacterium]